jgi:hypothetical protein
VGVDPEPPHKLSAKKKGRELGWRPKSGEETPNEGDRVVPTGSQKSWYDFAAVRLRLRLIERRAAAIGNRGQRLEAASYLLARGILAER